MAVSDKPFGEEWITEYFAMVDKRDLEEFARWYGEDCSFRFANEAPAKGMPAIRKALDQFYAQITSMRHEKLGCWTKGDSGAFEAIAHFTTKDGRKVELPAVSTLRIRDGLVHEFHFVMDAAPIARSAQ